MKILNFILNSFQFFVVDNGYTTADDSTEARVRIKKLTYDQVGGYTCRAQNKLGSAKKKFDVQLGSQTDCNIGLCESYSSAGSAGLNTNGIVFGISLIGSVILFMTVKWTIFTTHSEKKSFQKIRQRGIHIIASNTMSSTTTISILGTISLKNKFWISVLAELHIQNENMSVCWKRDWELSKKYLYQYRHQIACWSSEWIF